MSRPHGICIGGTALDVSDGAACLGSPVIDGLSLEVELKGHLESRSNLVWAGRKSAGQQACHRNHKAIGVPGRVPSSVVREEGLDSQGMGV